MEYYKNMNISSNIKIILATSSTRLWHYAKELVIEQAIE
jgi:hypothetical protein